MVYLLGRKLGNQEMTSHQTSSEKIISVHAVEPSTISTTELESPGGPVSVPSKGEEMAMTAEPVAVKMAAIQVSPAPPVDDNILPTLAPVMVNSEDQAEPSAKSISEQEVKGTASKDEETTVSTKPLPLQEATAPLEASNDNTSIPVPTISKSEDPTESSEALALALAPSTDPAESEVSSVTSMPARIQATGAFDSPTQNQGAKAQAESDVTSVVTAPTVMIDTDVGDSSGLDDCIVSPHGKNAIVERSPGGRYVRFMEKLGSGASKEVYRAYDTEEGIEVAWNVVNLAGVPKNERNRIVNEVRLLERLHHHNIISFHGSWVNRELAQVNFITEILSSGTLKSFITKVQVIRLKIAKRWAVQILKGLEYLHSQDPPVIHRDLKCDNIFINGTSGDLRIGDLGLSTVHRYGKVLSVLGTPEFMAPDMYEENSYDEKVDIYAFGMCLLEIFTKEIPYRECSNPAQIYKKVSRGDPPGSLTRLKDKQAREFIELCLGYKDKEERFVRPSATELLNHDFLQKCENDDNELEVEPPMYEGAIREAATESSSGTRGVSKQSQSQSEAVKDGVSPPKSKQVRSNSLEGDESCAFEEMPDREVNIRKVKVMMGRGRELKEDDDEPVKSTEAQPSIDAQIPPSTSMQDSQMVANPALANTNAAPIGTGNPATTIDGSSNQGIHYIVKAAVVGNEQQAYSRPYENDILKLILTLPVDGKPQNVQFDFHLIEDDPIQVAKEMVTELGIPQGVVLEISETISGLARTARMEQGKYAGQGIQPPGHFRSTSQGHVLQQPPMGSMNEYQNQGMMQSASHSSMPEYITTQPILQSQSQHNISQPLHQQGVHVQDQTVQMHSSMSQVQIQPQNMNMNPTMQSQQFGQPPQPDFQIQTPPSQIIHNQHQQIPMNPHNGDLQTVPSDVNQMSQSQYSHSVPVQNHPSNVPSIPNSGQADHQSQAASAAYGNAPMQHVQMAAQQAGPNSGAPLSDSQEQGASTAYSHPSQSRVQIQAQAMGQGVQMHNTGGMQSGEVQSQHSATQYAHNSAQLGQNQVMQQPVSVQTQPTSNVHHPPQQIHMASQAGQSQAYGQGVAASQQQLPPIPSQPQHQQTQVPPAQQQQQVPNIQQPQVSTQHQPPIQPQQQQAQSLPMQQQQPLGQQQPMPAAQQQTHSQIPSAQNPVGQQQPINQRQQQISGIQHQSQIPQSQLPALQQSIQAGHQVPGPPTQQVMPVASQSGDGGGAETAPQDYQPWASSGTEVNATSGSSSLQHSGPSVGPVSTEAHVNGVLGAPAIDTNADVVDESLASELRELEEEYQKSIMRAKKVFDSRMDNMQRMHFQREAQHQKTLVKHQTDRAEFEKRLQREELEQNRRIEQMQQELDRKREAVRQKQLEDAWNTAETIPDLLDSAPAPEVGSDESENY